MGTVTALLVARPLVAGEDPGRLRSPESVSGVVLNFLWLAVGLGVSVWLALSHRSPFRRLGVPAGLLIVTLLVAISGGVVPCYRHPAWLIGWEWAVLPIIFLAVRSLTSDGPEPDMSGGLLSALLASAVSLALFGVYQALAEPLKLPLPDAPMPTPEAISEGEYLGLPALDPPSWIARATFTRSDTLTAFLLLLLPTAGLFAFRDRTWRARAAQSLLIVLALGIYVSARDWWSSPERGNLTAGCSTAKHLVLERPLTGVGPGNFERHSARVQSPDLPHPLVDAGNAYLDLAATMGIPVLIAVCIVVARALRVIVHREDDESEPPNVEPAGGPRWEYYLGGVFGLLLGLFLRFLDLPASAAPQSIVSMGVEAVARSLVWFLAFALFDGVAWDGVARRRAIAVGMILTLAWGIVSPTPLLPAIAQPFWALAGLAVARAVTPASPLSIPRRWLPVLAMFAVTVAYLILTCAPAYESAMGLTLARRYVRHYPALFDAAVKASPGFDQKMRFDEAAKFLRGNVIKSLEQTRIADPFAVTAPLELAQWLRTEWNIKPSDKTQPALEAAHYAADLDPHGTAGLIQEFRIRLAYSILDASFLRPGRDGKHDPRVLKKLTEDRIEHFRQAEVLLERIIERDPALEARLRFRLAQALVNVNQLDRFKEAQVQARRAWQLDRTATGIRRQLTPDQRRLVQRWLGYGWYLIVPACDSAVIVPIGTIAGVAPNLRE